MERWRSWCGCRERIETAVETALGGALQHIVMQDERTARAAIAFLKQRQLGRATFLPLDVIKGRMIPEQDKRQAASMEGYVGVAAELVSCEPRYESIVNNLLGNVLLAETLEAANRIAARCGYRFRVVTLEGDVVNAGGSMTGGSLQKKGASLLGRQRQIEQLDEEAREMQRQLDRLRGELSDLRKEGSIPSKIGTSIGRRRSVSRSRSSSNARSSSMWRAKLPRLRSRELYSALTAADMRRSGVSWRRPRLMRLERLDELAIREAGLQEAITMADERRKASESAKEELQVQLTDLKIQVAKSDQERLAVQDIHSRLRADINRARSEASSLEASLGQRIAEQAALEEESVRQIEELNRLRLRKDECSEQTDFKRSARADKSRELELGESETRSSAAVSNGWRSSCGRRRLRSTGSMSSSTICCAS